MAQDAHHFWPQTATKSPSQVTTLISKLISSKDWKVGTQAIQEANEALAAAIKDHNKQSSAQYKQFLEHSLKGTASGGHGILKSMEKDSGASYEATEQQLLKLQGASIEERMISRINTRGIQKWKIHSSEQEHDMQEAGRLLQEACASSDIELPRYSIRHLRNMLKSSPAKTGLGADLLVLRL